ASTGEDQSVHGRNRCTWCSVPTCELTSKKCHAHSRALVQCSCGARLREVAERSGGAEATPLEARELGRGAARRGAAASALALWPVLGSDRCECDSRAATHRRGDSIADFGAADDIRCASSCEAHHSRTAAREARQPPTTSFAACGAAAGDPR